MKLTPARRRWLYRVSIAAIPIGIANGLFDVETAALIVPLLVALLNVPKGGPVEFDIVAHDRFPRRNREPGDPVADLGD